MCACLPNGRTGSPVRDSGVSHSRATVPTSGLLRKASPAEGKNRFGCERKLLETVRKLPQGAVSSSWPLERNGRVWQRGGEELFVRIRCARICRTFAGVVLFSFVFFFALLFLCN